MFLKHTSHVKEALQCQFYVIKFCKLSSKIVGIALLGFTLQFLTLVDCVSSWLFLALVDLIAQWGETQELSPKTRAYEHLIASRKVVGQKEPLDSFTIMYGITSVMQLFSQSNTLWSNHLFPIKTPSGNRRVPYFNQVRIDFGNFFSWVVKARFHVSWFLRVSFHVGRFFHL
jgi:hypothetical protein